MASTSFGRASLLKRRSNRMTLTSAIGISGEDRAKSSFTTGAKATGLNKHGAAIQINRELTIGTTVLVRNKRGTQISARIVAQLGTGQGGHAYGIEFIEQDAKTASFWGITFPESVSGRC